MKSDSIHPIAATLSAALNAAAALSFGLLCASSKFSLGVPTWSLWAVLGGPLAIATVAVLARFVAPTWPRGLRTLAVGRVS